MAERDITYFNKLREKILNLGKSILLIKTRLDSARKNVDPNSKNLRDQETNNTYISETEKRLVERESDLFKLIDQYNSEYLKTFGEPNPHNFEIDVEMEGKTPEKQSDTPEKTNTEQINTENNNNNNNKNDSDPQKDTPPNLKINNEGATGGIPVTTTITTPSTQTPPGTPLSFEQTKLIKQPNLETIPELKTSNRVNKRPGPYDTYKMNKKHATDFNLKIPTTYETFSDNLAFGKNSDWKPNDNLENRSNDIKNEEFDFRPLYDEDGNRIHQTQKTPQYNPTHTSDEKSNWHKNTKQIAKNDIPVVHQNQANSNPIKNMPRNQNKPDREKQRIDEHSTCKSKTKFQIYTDDTDSSNDESNSNQDMNKTFVVKNKPSANPNATLSQNANNVSQQMDPIEKARSTFLKRLIAIPELEGDNFENLRKFIDKVETLVNTATNQTEIDELYEH